MAVSSESVELLVIAVDNSGAHRYSSVAELVRDQGFGGTPRTEAVEFFDGLGYRLAPGFGLGWMLTSLVRTADGPDPDAVVRRLCAAVQGMADRIDKLPDELAALHVTQQQALAMLPHLNGLSLAEALDAGSELFGHTQNNRGDALHNFIVHGIW